MSDRPPGGAPPEKQPEEPTLAQAAASAAAAMFGVQSGKNREKDFKSRSPAKFIFMGAVMVCLFVTCVLFAVRCSMIKAGLGGN